jgi:hypothetical protein
MRIGTSAITALLMTLGLAACGGPRLPPQDTEIYRIQTGAGTIISPGQQAGYGITANVGGSYRLVWTGDAQSSGAYREFRGAVSTPGGFLQVTPGCAQGSCQLEADDVVANPVAIRGGGQAISFDAFTTVGIDGFDFVVDTEPVYFDLFIDGQRYPNLIFFPSRDLGGELANVRGFPFGLTTQ